MYVEIYSPGRLVSSDAVITDAVIPNGGNNSMYVFSGGEIVSRGQNPAHPHLRRQSPARLQRAARDARRAPGTGVPECAMTLDFAGFRTLDSVVRAKTAFGCDRIVIVSQRFHSERAVYIARKHGIDAVGFVAAENVSDRIRRRNHFREHFARVAAWLDVNVRRRSPKFVR